MSELQEPQDKLIQDYIDDFLRFCFFVFSFVFSGIVIKLMIMQGYETMNVISRLRIDTLFNQDGRTVFSALWMVFLTPSLFFLEYRIFKKWILSYLTNNDSGGRKILSFLFGFTFSGDAYPMYYVSLFIRADDPALWFRDHQVGMVISILMIIIPLLLFFLIEIRDAKK